VNTSTAGFLVLAWLSSLPLA